MTVAIRIGIGTVDPMVFLLTPRRVSADVRRGKFGLAGQKHTPLDVDAELDRKILERNSSVRSSKIIA